MNVVEAATKIRQKFEDDVVGVSGSSPGLPTQYDNKQLTVADDVTWARVKVLPADSSLEEIGAGKTWRTPGIALVSLFAPFGEGDGALLAIADGIARKFRSTKYQDVVFRTPSVFNVGRSGPFWQVNVSCPWYLDAHGVA